MQFISHRFPEDHDPTIAIIMQFISHRFPEDHDPTIEDAYKTQIRIDNEPANLDILDTAGQVRETRLAPQVSREEGQGLAREFQCPFFETSAAFRLFIDDVFVALVRQIRQHEKEAVIAMERKSRHHTSVWKRLKSPFRRKKD
ncbi:UNVERIFIED_CONTAM: hypothetical protein FKN15_053953 [Acipenser sinensis]